MSVIVNIIGYGHTGKGVLTSLFKEFPDDFYVPSHLTEFDLIRIQGGLVDLEYNVSQAWSMFRSDAAIVRFRKLVKRMGTVASLRHPTSLWTATGHNYENYFNNQFFDITDRFLEKLVSFETKIQWSPRTVGLSYFRTFLSRVMRILRIRSQTFNYSFVSDCDFKKIVREYLDSLFNAANKNNRDYIVVHNAIEPSPSLLSGCLDYFNNAKSIIVTRDPRDVYSSVVFANKERFTPNYLRNRGSWKIKSDFLFTHDIDKFIARWKKLHSLPIEIEDNRVLRLRFEDIVLKYDATIASVLDFINLDPKSHLNPKKYFIPEDSKSNVGLWLKNKDHPNVIKIQKELSEYCLPESFYKDIHDDR